MLYHILIIYILLLLAVSVEPSKCLNLMLLRVRQSGESWRISENPNHLQFEYLIFVLVKTCPPEAWQSRDKEK